MVDMVDAIRESCDVWFYEVARRVGINRIAEMARLLGLGEKTGIDLQGERPGLVPDKKWKLKHIGRKWQVGETLVAGIGQGYVLSTPLQLAVMTARVVNGGRVVKPHLARQTFERGDLVGDRKQPDLKQLDIPPAHLDVMIRAMDEAVNHPGGTAITSAIRRAGRGMGGKTGTSQVRRISQAERDTGVLKNEELAWRLRDHALFVGFAPVNKPRYVISVVVEHAGGGSTAAAPIARDVLRKAQALMPPEEREETA